MIDQYNTLRPLISNWIHNDTFKKDKDKVIEVHLSASSIIRKDYTINRIKNLISKHNLDLKVWEDDTMLQTDRFIISKQ